MNPLKVLKSSSTKMLKKVPLFIQNNGQTILSGAAIAGVIGSVFLASKAAPQAKDIIQAAKEELSRSDITEDEAKNLKRSAAIEVGKVYIPTLLSSTATILCICGARSVSQKRQAALAAALSLSESTMQEYKEKVKETFGEKKEQGVRDAIDKDRITKNPPTEDKIIFTGQGDYLCYDALSGRYFRSDITKIERAINQINQRLMTEMYISLNELYDEYGIPGIELGDDLGWSVDSMIELSPSYQAGEDGATPCMVINYLNGPSPIHAW